MTGRTDEVGENRSLASVPVECISLEPWPCRVRQSYDDAEVEQMADAIAAAGRVIVPILLAPAPKESPFRYRVLDGGLRLSGLARCRERGVPLEHAEIAAEILESANPLYLLRTALAARPGLPRRPLEIAWALARYADLAQESGAKVTLDDLGRLVEITHRGTISNALRFGRTVPRDTIDALAHTYGVSADALVDGFRRKTLRVIAGRWTEQERGQLIRVAAAAVASGRHVPTAVIQAAGALAATRAAAALPWWRRFARAIARVAARTAARLCSSGLKWWGGPVASPARGGNVG